MVDEIGSFLSQFPVWTVLGVTALIATVVGFALARKIWGGNIKRLKAALDDSAYLAGQWVTLGISQSQLVEKLGKRVASENEVFHAKEAELLNQVRDRDFSIRSLQDEIAKLESSRTSLTEREVEVMQVQAAEIHKRDARIQNLEARIVELSSKSEHNECEHQKQVKILLQRINVLEECPNDLADTEIVESNRQLTELLKERCAELERLRDEFYGKEKELNRLKQHNSSLAKGVQELAAKWERNKRQITELDELKAKLEKNRGELIEVRKEYEKRGFEIEALQQKLSQPEDREMIEELAVAKTESLEKEGEIERLSSQVDMLLNVISSREEKIEKLEKQLTAGSSRNENSLRQSISNLESEVSEARDKLSKAQHHLRAKDEQLSAVRSKLGDSALKDLGIALEHGLDNHTAPIALKSRVLTESKSHRSRRLASRREGGGKSIIYFEEDSAEIGEESIEKIQSIARDVLETGCQISVVGFSDQESDAEQLSTRRAEAVLEKFAEEGVSKSLVMVKGRGEDVQYARTAEAWKARRVEIVVLPVAEIVN